MAARAWRLAFFWLFVRPVCLIWLGFRVRRAHLIAPTGPAILVANHNSHLDIFALFALFPARRIASVRPVAAADYFMRNPLIAWASTRLLGIIPVARTAAAGPLPHAHPLAECHAALRRGETLILFPEGTRGEPEKMQALKAGIASLAKDFPDVPVTPVFMHGLGKALPRGSLLPIPIFVDLYIGEPLGWTGDKASYLAALAGRFEALSLEHGRTTFLDPGAFPHDPY